MKLRVAAILAAGLAMIASPGYAQNMTFGGKIGVNFADVNQTTGPDTTDKKSGLVLGGFVEMPLTKAFSFQPEVLYTQKGAKDHTSTPNPKISVDMIQIPLLAKFNVGVQGSLHPYVTLGPGLGFVTRAKVSDDTDSIDIKDDTESFDPTFLIGFGVNVHAFAIEARYDVGFRDLAIDDPGEIPVTAKTRTFSITGGYTFGKKK